MAYHDRGTEEEPLIVPTRARRRLDAVLMAPDSEGALVRKAAFWAISDSYPCFLAGFHP